MEAETVSKLNLCSSPRVKLGANVMTGLAVVLVVKTSYA